jgi:titin
MLRHRVATFVLSGVAVVATATALTSAALAADTTPPGPVTNLTAQSNTPTSVHLDWTNPTAADFSHVRICRADGTTIPTRPCTGLNLAKPTSQYTDSKQLIPNHQYTYALWAFDAAGNASARRSVTVRTQAKTPPGNVTGLSATPLDDGSIQLNWTNPGDSDFAGVRLCRATGATAPTLPCGIKLAKPADSYNDSRNLIPGQVYTYSVFAYDTVGSTASGAHVSATPLATPPGNVTDLTATTLSDSSIKLDWTNPGDSDFAGVRICRAIGDTAPTLPCAGVNVLKPTNTFTDNNGLFPDTEYTYAVFAFDTVGGAASGATASATTDPAPLSAPVTDLTVTATSPTSIELDWTNPDDPNFAGVLICANLGDVAPTTPCTGVALANPTNTYTDDFNVFPGTEYTYAVFALNEEGNPSSGPSATVTTPAS